MRAMPRKRLELIDTEKIKMDLCDVDEKKKKVLEAGGGTVYTLRSGWPKLPYGAIAPAVAILLRLTGCGVKWD